jgi:hypothetical protein
MKLTIGDISPKAAGKFTNMHSFQNFSMPISQRTNFIVISTLTDFCGSLGVGIFCRSPFDEVLPSTASNPFILTLKVNQ